MFDRRQFSVAAYAGIVGCLIASPKAGAAQTNAEWSDKLVRSLNALEKERGGRLGVAVLDTQSGGSANHRGGERFPICSTFKTLAVAATLARVDAGKEQLERRVRFTAQDVVVNSPITKDRAGNDGMSLAEICEADMIVSDNTAGN
jgi:beta-lactamase class A